MKSHQCTKIEELTTLKNDLKYIDNQLKELHIAVFGNGRRGIKENLNQLLTGIKMIKYFGSAGGISGILALIITLIRLKGGC